MSAAARWCGYRNPSHFTKAFRERYGVTPSFFRRVAKIENRLVQRRFVAKVRPVSVGSYEYFRRRKRYNEDVRMLHALVVDMPVPAKEALLRVRSPERLVIELSDRRETIETPPRGLTTEQFEALFERRLHSFEELHPAIDNTLGDGRFDALIDG